MQKPGKAPTLHFAQMSKQLLNRDLSSCVLCGVQMLHLRTLSGLAVHQLLINAVTLVC
ncbi:ISPsy3, transposase [Pseudomonas syringae pv. pisi]|uniref:ISPsy3, transposase n=2 Tax=Pseudomonas syringae group TaxID=136849 RepID=A0A2K4X0I1_PSESX|nr:ISPsy3, transposase [Pseudomonas syringae pv. pisi]RMU26324.1 hypothetical protein ALP31_200001 [Pseudomonas amygdali pv. morsprunorum]RMU86508.1 hypothetical protein ALP21_200208 [Pseudomonas savastanoi pv. phaseolicola]SOS41649.1 hypothetical protein CFBP3840_04633 [Pseudomonas syringae]RML65469.1 hypothetical protein ALQ92_200074 [Pseudomonas syringae pv. pisi]